MLMKLEISLKTLFKLVCEGEDAFWVELGSLEKQQEDTHLDVHLNIIDILQKFDSLFCEPYSPPSCHKHDHAIKLLEGAQPPNLRPYKYPHYQKGEIEKIVQEMVVAGVISPIISPFSSLVILVKKKDSGWQFCVDYRTLNKVTMPDKFPILTIDKLLDQLYGA